MNSQMNPAVNFESPNALRELGLWWNLTRLVVRRPGLVSVQTDYIKIGPKEAAYIFRNYHPLNRRLKPSRVAMYVRDMENGSWLVTGESIKFDYNGNLIDGQHRLQAIINSGQTFLLAVTTGLSPDAIRAIDKPAVRSVRDDKTMLGIRNGAFYQSVANAIVSLRYGTQYQLSANDIDLVIGQCPFFDAVVEVCATNKLTSWAPFMGTAVVISKAYPNNVHSLVEEFINKIKTGANLSGDDSRLLLRNRLVVKETETKKTSRPEWAKRVLKAYNLFRNEKTTTRLYEASVAEVEDLFKKANIQLPISRKKD